MGAFAWVTLATNDSYSLGALVLAHSLKQVGTAHQLAVLITPGVTNAMRDKLASVFNIVQEVNILDSRDQANLRLLKRPELGITFTKLHCWRLTQFEKCVFLDADTLVLENSDELFEREELSAAPDVGWPDCFNSGVFVYRPSLDTYEQLIKFALEKGSFDGGDQGLLNLYFSDWAHKDISKHLPFIYNMCSTACYSYLPAFKQFGANAKIIHFIGAQKPWLQYFNTETKKVQPSGDSAHLQEILQRWWDIFCSLIHPHLSPAMQGQSQHGMSPSYFPPQYDPPPNPTASADDYENTWDPWDEYDQKIAQNTHQHTSISTHYNEPIESLNTNASRAADQASIHSQPQSQVYNTRSVQNNSYYQPPPTQVVYHFIPRVPTPPPTPQPEHHHEPPHFEHHEPQHFHSEPQNYHSEPQIHHVEHHHEPQYHHSDPEPQYQEVEPQYHQVQYNEQQSHFDNNQQHNDNSESVLEHQKDDHVFSISHQIPDSPDPIPILSNECKATTTVSNDMSIEDSSNQQDAGLAGAFSHLTLGVARTPEQDAFENILRKQAWEVGNIDYLGKDSFENIWSKITETLSVAPPQAEESVPVDLEEVPAAPAESQSQTAPQEEAISVQPPVLPIDTPTDNILDSSAIVEAPQEPIIASSEEAATETATAVPEAIKEIEPSVPVEEVVSSPVSTPDPPVSIEKETVAETKASESPVSIEKEIETPTPQAPLETVPPKKSPVIADEVPPESPKVVKSAVAPKEPAIVAAEPAIDSQKSESSQSVVSAPIPSSPSAAAIDKPKGEPSGKTTAAAAPELDVAKAAASPKTKVTEATPPATPVTPPVEKTKQALAAAANIPDTPPPSEEGSTPTPPPRKTDKPKKVAAKSKK